MADYAKSEKIKQTLKKRRTYKFECGDIIKNNQVLELTQTTVKNEKTLSGYTTQKMYKVKCLICGNESIINENSVKNGRCAVCKNIKIIKGINDVATTHPHLLKYFKNKEDAYKVSYGSTKKIRTKCEICGHERDMVTSVLNRFSCSHCGDGISFPEKFVISALTQLGVQFTTQLNKKTFEWCNNYKYDFYLNQYNTIIETHGMQHYENCGFRKSVEETQHNDKLKEETAKQNGIKNYIVIDCRHSDIEWIRKNIIKSELCNLFELENIDWKKCEEFAVNSLLKEASNLWNNGLKNTKEISEILNLHQSTIVRYLNKARKLGFCDYTREISIKNMKKPTNCKTYKKVFCDGKIFNKVVDCARFYDVNERVLSSWLTKPKTIVRKTKTKRKELIDLGLRFATQEDLEKYTNK